MFIDIDLDKNMTMNTKQYFSFEKLIFVIVFPSVSFRPIEFGLIIWKYSGLNTYANEKKNGKYKHITKTFTIVNINNYINLF